MGPSPHRHESLSIWAICDVVRGPTEFAIYEPARVPFAVALAASSLVEIHFPSDRPMAFVLPARTKCVSANPTSRHVFFLHLSRGKVRLSRHGDRP